jgi:hypothetical protein
MSQALCEGHLKANGIDAATLAQLQAFPGLDWSQLWALLQQFQADAPKILAVIKAILPLAASGANWVTILSTILPILLGTP